jgi:hypothetical protein
MADTRSLQKARLGAETKGTSVTKESRKSSGQHKEKRCANGRTEKKEECFVIVQTTLTELQWITTLKKLYLVCTQSVKIVQQLLSIP